MSLRKTPLRRTPLPRVGLTLRKVGLRRSATLHDHRTHDPVTPQVHAEVIARDLRIANGCVAPFLDALAGECRDRWHNLVRPYAEVALTTDHIRAEPGGQRHSQPRWLVTVCWGHHVNGGWATSHRPLLRRYLAEHGGPPMTSEADR